jgi:uncharacterized membrane protein HdeD (DUF308 family)
MQQLLVRAEREAAVERAGDRIAYLVLSYGLLLVVAYRSFAGQQPSWDLLALVFIGGLAGAAYRLWHRAMTRQAALLIGVTVLVALAVGLVVAVTLRPA